MEYSKNILGIPPLNLHFIYCLKNIEEKSTKRVSSLAMLKFRFMFHSEQPKSQEIFWVAINSVPNPSRNILGYHIFDIAKLTGQDVKLIMRVKGEG